MAVDNVVTALTVGAVVAISVGEARKALAAKQESAIVSIIPTPRSQPHTVLKWFSNRSTPATAGNAALDAKNCCE